MTSPRFPDVRVDLYVYTEHAFCSLSLIGRACKALRSGGATNDEVRLYVAEASAAVNYSYLVGVTECWVDTTFDRWRDADIDNDLDAEGRQEAYEARQPRD